MPEKGRAVRALRHPHPGLGPREAHWSTAVPCEIHAFSVGRVDTRVSFIQQSDAWPRSNMPFHPLPPSRTQHTPCRPASLPQVTTACRCCVCPGAEREEDVVRQWLVRGSSHARAPSTITAAGGGWHHPHFINEQDAALTAAQEPYWGRLVSEWGPRDLNPRLPTSQESLFSQNTPISLTLLLRV